MTRLLLSLCAKLLRKVSAVIMICSRLCDRGAKGATLLQKGVGRNLYRTRYGDMFWLAEDRYIDSCLIRDSVFEEASTNIVKRLVRKDWTALDVGANIGYYSVLLSRAVGNSGRVIAFEPTHHFSKVLESNLKANGIKNVDVQNLGLSDKRQQLPVQIGDSSATLHSPEGKNLDESEVIELVRLDDLVEDLGIKDIGFIKVDIDGHEPQFMDGAKRSLERWDPLILLEVNHLNYFEAGVYAWDFYERLRKMSYRIYDENLSEISSRTEFLVKCANFAYSANIVLTKRALSTSL